MNEDELNQDLLAGDDAGLDGYNESPQEAQSEGDEYDDAAEAEVEAPVAEATAPEFRAARPFTPSGNPHWDEIASDLEDVGLGHIAVKMRLANQFDQQQGFAAQTYAGNYLGQAQQAVPEYYRAHADAIAEGAAMCPPELKGTPAGAVFALFTPVMRKVQETGNVGAAMQEMARLMGGTPNATRAPQTTRTLAKVPQTPSPSASAGGGNRSQPARQLQQSGSRAASYLQELGLDAGESKSLARKL